MKLDVHHGYIEIVSETPQDDCYLTSLFPAVVDLGDSRFSNKLSIRIRPETMEEKVERQRLEMLGSKADLEAKKSD